MEELTEKGTLPHGLQIGEELAKEFEIAAIRNVGEMMDAEQDADADKAVSYNAALMCRQLRRLGSYTGPFTIGMVRKLKPGDYFKLRAAQNTLDGRAALEGKPEPSA